MFCKPDKFCDLTYCKTGVMSLICHVTSRDNTLNGLCEFSRGRSSRYVTTLSSLLVAIGQVQVEI